MADAPDYRRDTLGSFLDAVASRQPAPGGGAVAAVAAALAAGLCAMAGRFAGAQVAEAEPLVARAEALRAQVAPLAGEDAAAYGRVLEAFALPKDDPAQRRAVIRERLSEAADVPLDIAGVAAEVADIAASLAQHGNSNLRGDAVAAAVLAQAACEAAATLVEINLNDDDARVSRARSLIDAAAAAAATARRAALGAR